jgi:hypothetical protein
VIGWNSVFQAKSLIGLQLLYGDISLLMIKDLKGWRKQQWISSELLILTWLSTHPLHLFVLKTGEARMSGEVHQKEPEITVTA